MPIPDVRLPVPPPAAFPEPTTVAEPINGVQFVPLATLIELKLASGMSANPRLKDLADVQEVIKSLELTLDFADRLNPYVRDKYVEIWKNTYRE